MYRAYFLKSVAFLIIICSVGKVQAQNEIHITDSGFYSDSVIVQIEGVSDSSSIFYTLDGAFPDTASALFQDSLSITETSALRVMILSDDRADTSFFFRSYFIDEPTEMPILSVTTNPAGFFSDSAGIYVEGTNGIPGYCRSTPKNWNQDWERPVHLAFFEKDHTPGFSVNAGVKIGGGCTRLYDQKSLDIYFRGEYGLKKLNYPLFEDKPFTEFDRLALRSGGQDWYRAMIRNASIQAMMKDRMDLGYQAFKPVVVFLNGEYWGIHILREKQNEDFIESNYGYDEDELDILTGNANVKEGSDTHYQAMINFMKNNDLSVQENYEWVSRQMDIDQYIDYVLTEIYMANGDWPANNIRFWRPQVPGGKWRWIMYDMDMTMNSHTFGQDDTNSLELVATTNNIYYANPGWSTFLFRSLLSNERFRNKFIQRYSIHIQASFSPGRLLGVIDSTAALIESEIPRHMDRWDKSFRLGSGMNWEKHLERMKVFVRSRQTKARTHLQNFFEVSGVTKLEVSSSPAEGGAVTVETVRSDTTDWVLIYKSIPTTIKAIPAPGYSFVGWSVEASGTDTEADITIESEASLTAVFKRNDLSDDTPVVINEINYNSAEDFDPEDWIEFYNNTESNIDLGGWYFSDSDDEHIYTFADGTIVESGGFLVLTRDSTLFTSLFPEVNNYVGDLDFGFAGSGELVRLFNNTGDIVDQLTYSDDPPWPAEADGEGATLSLTHPRLDNSKAENWAASVGHGTPGAENSGVLVGTEEEQDEEIAKGFELYQNYPNPFNPTTTISYRLDKPGRVKIAVYDIMGREVAVLENGVKSQGIHSLRWDASPGKFSSGVYLYKLDTGNQSLIRKLTLIK
ncbi:MAG: CotH kinase family protein [Gracilimonas sp.]|uniref:CotH kinase family protein n=1 Tax=Gracilimonas TaxID=649462 RepID=UPI001B232FDD|nr:CotH kinase family protein [Gracilimonas sp.]MBO6587383.1 CotH kinase family protein [Gracilimonas sp.]MBO6614131.1 CotH kinase family protein [Gracilimonas sp.]